jgi:hypothetical protein
VVVLSIPTAVYSGTYTGDSVAEIGRAHV